MKKLLLIIAMACVGCVSQTIDSQEVVCCSAKKSATADKAAVKLFNEQDLSNWENVYSYGDAKIVGNELHLTSTGNWFISTKKKYKDFIPQNKV